MCEYGVNKLSLFYEVRGMTTQTFLHCGCISFSISSGKIVVLLISDTDKQDFMKKFSYLLTYLKEGEFY